MTIVKTTGIGHSPVETSVGTDHLLKKYPVLRKSLGNLIVGFNGIIPDKINLTYYSRSGVVEFYVNPRTDIHPSEGMMEVQSLPERPISKHTINDGFLVIYSEI